MWLVTLVNAVLRSSRSRKQIALDRRANRRWRNETLKGDQYVWMRRRRGTAGRENRGTEVRAVWPHLLTEGKRPCSEIRLKAPRKEEIPLDRVATHPSFLGQSSDAPIVTDSNWAGTIFHFPKGPNLDNTLSNHPSYGASSQRRCGPKHRWTQWP